MMHAKLMVIVLIGIPAFLAIADPARADVVSVEREGFVLHISANVPAAPDAVFAALAQPQNWWDSEHSWSGDARNMRMDARVGGCWCEGLRQDGGVEHGRIIRYDPAGGSIMMESLLGPLLTMGQSGRLSWQVERNLANNGSRINWTYRVAMLPSGNLAQDASLAAAVDDVLQQQVARLVAHVTGAPMPAPPS